MEYFSNGGKIKKVISNTKKKTISGGAKGKGKSKGFRPIQNQINNNNDNNDNSPELDSFSSHNYNNSYDEQKLNRYKKKHKKNLKNYLKPYDIRFFSENYCDALIYDDTLEVYEYILRYDDSMSFNDKMLIAQNILNILYQCMNHKQIIIDTAEKDVEKLSAHANSFEGLLELNIPSENHLMGEPGVWSLPIKSRVPLSNYLPRPTNSKSKFNSEYPKLS
jgi:hypothetical protein